MLTFPAQAKRAAREASKPKAEAQAMPQESLDKAVGTPAYARHLVAGLLYLRHAVRWMMCRNK